MNRYKVMTNCIWNIDPVIGYFYRKITTIDPYIYLIEEFDSLNIALESIKEVNRDYAVFDKLENKFLDKSGNSIL